MKSHIKLSIINLVVLITIGLFISYYGLYVGESEMSVYVAYAGAILIAYAFHGSWAVSKHYRKIENRDDK